MTNSLHLLLSKFSQVNLTANIINHSGTCIDNPENFSNKTFDCQGYRIDGVGMYVIATGILLLNPNFA